MLVRENESTVPVSLDELVRDHRCGGIGRALERVIHLARLVIQQFVHESSQPCYDAGRRPVTASSSRVTQKTSTRT